MRGPTGGATVPAIAISAGIVVRGRSCGSHSEVGAGYSLYGCGWFDQSTERRARFPVSLVAL